MSCGAMIFRIAFRAPLRRLSATTWFTFRRLTVWARAAAKIAKDGDKWTATELWTSPTNCRITGRRRFIKTAIFMAFIKTAMACVASKWRPARKSGAKGGFAWEGATTLVDGDVLVQNNRGEIVLVKATPDNYEELARAQPLGGQCWTMATVTDGRIFARSMTEAVCLDVKPQSLNCASRTICRDDDLSSSLLVLNYESFGCTSIISRARALFSARAV